VPYPEWGPKILVAHLCPPGEGLAPNDEVSDARVRRRQTKLLYTNHRSPPRLTEDATTEIARTRLLGSERETQIQDRRGKTKRRSHHMKLRPMLKQSARLRRAEIATRCKQCIVRRHDAD